MTTSPQPAGRPPAEPPGSGSTESGRRTGWIVAIVAAVVVGVLILCGGAVAGGVYLVHRATVDNTRDDGAPRDEVVTTGGIDGIEFGTTESELIARHGLRRPQSACGARFRSVPHVDPVLADGRLVLLWVHRPAHVPPGLSEGATVAEVRTAYPGATALTPPAGSYRFAGLLVTRGDRGYLFLHNGQVVQKVVVGYTTYLRRLFDEGFGTC